MTTINLVAGNTPQLVFDLFDRNGPIDVSAGSTTVRLYVRANATPVVCTKLTGYDNGDTIDSAAPYDVAGAGGRVRADCDQYVFPAAGRYAAEIQIDANGVITTVYDDLIVNVRAAHAEET